MSAVVVEQGLVHYEVIGQGRRGRPLVFIHGWLGSWRYWVPTMEDLAVGQRAYAFDLWGFGDSDRVKVCYDIGAYVRLLDDFLERLGVWGVTLVGHALGGIVALLFAAQAPDRVERVLGVSVPLVGTDINRPLANFSGDGDALARLVARRARFPEVEMEVRKTDASAVARSAHSVMGYDLRVVLPPIALPVLLVYGGNDPLIRPPQPEWLRDCEDNVRMILLDGAQHFPMLTERNKFTRLLKEFLEVGDDLRALELKEEWQRRQR